ncbi:hypothetical protein [Desulfovibrio sp. QI0434]
MKKNNYLSALGFNMGLGGAHISRTMMLEELSILLAHTSRIDAEKKEYLHAIIAENCLGKRSAKTRTLTGRYLVDLYSLDYKNRAMTRTEANKRLMSSYGNKKQVHHSF